jgi:thioredoxin-related protein
MCHPSVQCLYAHLLIISVAFVALHFNFHLGNHFTIFVCVLLEGRAQAQELIIPKPVNFILSMLYLSCSWWKCKTQSLQSYKKIVRQVTEMRRYFSEAFTWECVYIFLRWDL